MRRGADAAARLSRVQRLLAGALTAGLATFTACGGPGAAATATTSSAGQMLSLALRDIRATDYTTARAELNKVLKQDHSSYLAYYDLGVIDQTLGKDQGALAEYAQALAIDDKFVPALYNEAVITSSSSPGVAMTLYQAIIRLQPMAPTAYLNLGILEIRAGQVKQGENDLRVAEQQDPGLAANVRTALKNLKPTKSPNTSSTSSTTSTTAGG